MNIVLRLERLPSLCLPMFAIFAVSHSVASDIPEWVAETDKKVMQIERLQANEVKKSLFTGTDGGGTLSAFVRDGQIGHVKITIGMSNRKIEEDFYYENSQLTLAISRQSFFRWDDEMQKLDVRTVARTLEDRYYFLDGKLRHWTESGSARNLVTQGADFMQKEKTVSQEASFFMQAARSEMDKVDVELFIKQGRH